VLLEDGAEVLRVSAPDADSPLLLTHVAPLAQDALKRHPAAREPAAPMDSDGGDDSGK
jgi:hypothetical protein